VKFSEYFISTLKQEPADSDIPSYSLLLRACYIKKIASGIYTFMPLGFRVLKKIENIVREEMDNTGAIELLMPAIQPSDLWIESGRWYEYGPELFRLKDRNNREFCLGPTHEELITSIARQNIKSYKDMPINLYQIQVKFRDEMRPRYGILRAREFIMKDAYSFTSNEKDLDEIYNKMFNCYSNILNKLNLKYFAVEADTGLIGGKYSHEFIILAKNGEDKIVCCSNCGYSANYQMAQYNPRQEADSLKRMQEQEILEIKEVYTPDKKTIKSLSGYLKVKPQDIVKTLILKNDKNDFFAILLRGDKELNIQKVEKFLSVRLNLVEDKNNLNGLEIGFLGPVKLKKDIRILADYSIKNMHNFITGANKKDYHYLNVNLNKDFTIDSWGDFSYPDEKDLCIKCKSQLKFEKGIEIGHIFKLGTRYSEKMNATFLDKDGNLKPIIMGCYGIGISRILSACVEQLYDEQGIIWPIKIAPFLVNVIAINIENKEIFNAANEIYLKIKNENLEVIFDDRNVSAGIKFKDSDLIGIPIKLIVGKKYIENKKVEIELRKDKTKLNLDLDSAIDYVKKYSLTNSF